MTPMFLTCAAAWKVPFPEMRETGGGMALWGETASNCSESKCSKSTPVDYSCILGVNTLLPPLHEHALTPRPTLPCFTLKSR